ncbi:hypothetical protein D4758_16770 [Enterocloster citroniae]|nr:hypothetical protein [Enterocloster citroniae]
MTPVGSQIKKGEILAHKGEMLHPALLGVLAGAGYRSVFCLRAPKGTVPAHGR